MNKEIKDILIERNKRGLISTDSDVMELAEEYNLTYEEVMLVIAQDEFGDTSCSGCRHIGNLYGGYAKRYPCNTCSRVNQVEDHYIPLDDFEEN